MQLRNLGIFVGFMGLFYSGLINALGLGEITLKSSYNEPLKAEIRLLQVRDLSKEQILVSLASREDFKRVGVDRFFFLTDLAFDVVLRGSTPVILVTSIKPIQEPYLNFLVEAQWPSGRLLREYTLLFDLPVFGGQANARVSAPSRSVTTGSTTRSSLTPVASVPQTQSFATSGDYRVRAGDTMWEIAAKMRPSNAVTVQQTMLAIQDLNPDAFINGNINLLRKGQVLRAPDTSEIEANSHREAVAAIRQQHQSWSKKSNKAPLSAASSASTNNTAPPSSSQGRLTLGSADSSDTTNAAKGTGASGAGESLQNELAIAQEELDKASRENSDLKARVAELESQVETMENLVKLSNDQLKALELATQQNNTTDPDIVDPVDNTDPVESVDPTAIDEPTSTSIPDPALVTPEPAPVIVPEPEVTTSEPVVEVDPVVVDPVEPVVDRGIIGLIMDNIVYIGGALLALLLGLFFFKNKRSHSDSEEDFNEYEFDEDAPHLDDAPDQVAAFAEDEIANDDLAAVDIDAVEDAVEAKTEDAVAEADIYLSLGQEDKAEGLLQKEIQQNPDNADARLALLKMYAKAQNASSFDDQYAQLLPLGNVNANNEAEALRGTIAGITDFDTDSYSLGDVNMDLSSDTTLDLDTDSGALNEDSPIEAGDLDLDLDLDFDNDVDFLSDEPNSSIETNDLDLGEESGLLDSGDSLDEDINLDLGEEASELTDSSADELEIELDLDLDDLDMENDFSADSISEGVSLDIGDDESLSNDVLALDEQSNREANLDLGLEDDFIADLDLEGVDELDVTDSTTSELDNGVASLDDLDIDLPADDLDIESLDKEIDEMTATLEGPEDNLAASVFDNAESVMDSGLDTLDTDMASIDNALESSLDDVDGVTEYGLDDLLDDNDLNDDLSNVDDANVTIDSSGIADLALDNTKVDFENATLDDQMAAVSNEAVSIESLQEDFSAEDDNLDLGEDTEVIDDLDFLDESDEVTTKLDLARAYIDMGDREGAQDILDEVLEEGNQDQQVQAKTLLDNL